MTQTWTATISKIDPIPGKDRIVLATIEGYQAITGNDRKVGDRVCYISDQSILPPELIEELGAASYLAGAEHNRVKPMKMGGVLSQGIICRPHKWVQFEGWTRYEGDGKPDLDEHLGVTKWAPVVPQHLSGKLVRPRGNAPIVGMYDVENIKKLRHWEVECDGRGGFWDTDCNEWRVCPVDHIDLPGHWFDPFNGEKVVVTEKIHGTNIGLHMNRDDMELHVYSKGLGNQGWTLVEDDGNTYWNAVHRHPEIIDYMRIAAANEDSVTCFGEVYGPGIQDLTYGVPQGEPDLALFEIRLYDHRIGAFHLNANDIAGFVKGNVPTVPVLWTGVYDYDTIKCLSEVNVSVVDGVTLREGVVVVSETHSCFVNGNRKVAKFINPNYLTRKNGSEFN